MKSHMRELVLTLVAILGLSACATDKGMTKAQLAELHSSLCTAPQESSNPWNMSNLYDCQSQSLYIPYQMWTGAEWNGDKSASCMHKADLFFSTNFKSPTTIKGPFTWTNPQTGKQVEVWERVKTNGSKTQRFACHDKGIGRVYDSRGPRYYDVGRCKFPAGYGWKVGEKRPCAGTAIEITSISLDEQNNLKGLTFKWWTGSYLDHIYQYANNKGLLYAWKQ